MAFSARAKSASAVDTSSPTTSRYDAAELGEQQPLRLELGPGPSGQAVGGHDVDADQLTGLAGRPCGRRAG